MPVHNEDANDGFRTPESFHSSLYTDSRIFPEINNSASSNDESQIYPRPYPPISQTQPDRPINTNTTTNATTNTTITRRVWSPPLAGSSRYQRISQNASFSVSGSSEFFTSTTNPFTVHPIAPWRGQVTSVSREMLYDNETYQRMLESIRRAGREYSHRQERGRLQTSRFAERTGQHPINENVQEESEESDTVPAQYDYASDVESSESSHNSPVTRHNTPSSNNLQVSRDSQNRIVGSSLINIGSFERRYGGRLSEEQLNYLEQRINELQRSTYEQYGFTQEQYEEMLNSVGEDDGDTDL
jgi:hypothetical protein